MDSVILHSAQDDVLGWEEDCEPQIRKGNVKKERNWTMLVIALMLLKFWGLVDRSAQNR